MQSPPPAACACAGVYPDFRVLPVVRRQCRDYQGTTLSRCSKIGFVPTLVFRCAAGSAWPSVFFFTFSRPPPPPKARQFKCKQAKRQLIRDLDERLIGQLKLIAVLSCQAIAQKMPVFESQECLFGRAAVLVVFVVSRVMAKKIHEIITCRLGQISN